MKDINRLETDNIDSLIWKFSLPAIVGMITNASYNVVDRIFVGQGVGSNAISAITMTFPLLMFTFSFAMLFGIGAGAVVSLKLGEKEKSIAEKALGSSLFLSIFTSFILTLLYYIFLNHILVFFGAKGEILELSMDYLKIILLGIIFQITSFVLNAVIRGEGNPRIAMFTMIIGAVSNTILDAIFIFGFGWGIKGAAFATVLAQVISAIWVLVYFLNGKSLLKLSFNNINPDKTISKQIVGIGFSPFIMHIAGSGIFILLNSSFLYYGGPTAVAAMGIINSTVMFILMPVFGLNQGIQPIIGYNFGAKQYARVKKLLSRGIIYASIVCFAGFLLLISFPKEVIRLFSSDDLMLLEVGRHGLTIYVLSLPIIGFQVILGAYFQAIGKPMKSIILTLTRQIIFIIPLVLILPKFYGLDGLWAFAPIADYLAAVLALIFLFSENNKLRNQSNSKI
ncbi:MAG TPA: MATE family efflux transporter [Candidatus Kapabacteria bacterium]|nr:MATE family efflux transporter [Candidatus Kapabacteria bacterium]